LASVVLLDRHLPWMKRNSQLVYLNPQSGRWLPERSHRQRHVNIAIAYNVWQHYMVTESVGFLRSKGAELLVEIGRFWTSLAKYDREAERYEIHGVMGPDEYHDGYPGSDEEGLRITRIDAPTLSEVNGWWRDRSRHPIPRAHFGMIEWSTFSDPSLAPAGNHVLNVMMAGTYHGVDWDKDKNQFVNGVIRFLSQGPLPGLSEHVRVATCATPLASSDALALDREVCTASLRTRHTAPCFVCPTSRRASSTSTWLARQPTQVAACRP
jgi:Glycosyl hydrolase family 65 central catalytic domain